MEGPSSIPALANPDFADCNKVRQMFIDFFCQKKEHLFVPSSSVVPHEDPTLLFTNAGMNQFKPLFLGTVDPKSEQAKWKRAANSQKCIRAGGKHNDLDDVGKDVYHHTFFEMLGNWSFGDYFKEEAIVWAWELLTDVLKLDSQRLYATYFGGDAKTGLLPDEEAKKIWQRYLPDHHILPFGMKDNFWEMGDTGPCGPCTEIHYDKIGGRDAGSLVNMDDPTVIEIWNLVFMQFNREDPTTLKKLPAAHVDTGMGFERLVAALQNVPSNYDTDVFAPLFIEIEKVCKAPHPYTGKLGKDDVGRIDTAYRVIADHIRTLTFAIADGARPSNIGRGYVLRRVLRRAVHFGRNIMGCQDKSPFFCKLVDVVITHFGAAFPEIKSKKQTVIDVLKREEKAFMLTLDKGVAKFSKLTKDIPIGSEIDPKIVFDLYTSYGFPVDLTEILADEKGLKVSRVAFERLMQGQKAHDAEVNKKVFSARSALKLDADAVKFLQGTCSATDDLAKYKLAATSAKIMAIFDGQQFLPRVDETANAVGFVLDRTNFYAEQGGQVYDVGQLSADSSIFGVADTQVYAGYVLHIGGVQSGTFAVGDEITCTVDIDRRLPIMNNHTSTHMINWALRNTLGAHVDQKGSLVEDSKFRFDFSHDKSMSSAEVSHVEKQLHDLIAQDLPVFFKEVSLADAQKIHGLRAVFGEVYPDPVRVVSIGRSVEDLLRTPDAAEWMNYSIEFCGGTHIRKTSVVGSFAVISEEGLAAGIRRVVAVTGEEAKQAFLNAQRIETVMVHLRGLTEVVDLDAGVIELRKQIEAEVLLPAARVIEWREELHQLKQKVVDASKAQKKDQEKAADDFATAAAAELQQSGQKYLVRVLDVGFNPSILANCAQKIATLCPDVPICLLSPEAAKQKIAVTCNVPSSLVGKLKAGDWAKHAAGAAGGKGGGKPTVAQGVGTDVSKLQEAVDAATEFVVKSLGA